MKAIAELPGDGRIITLKIMLPKRPSLRTISLRLTAVLAALLALCCAAFADTVSTSILSLADADKPLSSNEFPEAVSSGALELVDDGGQAFHPGGYQDWSLGCIAIDINPATGEPAIAYCAYGAPNGAMQAFFSQRNPDGSWSLPSKISYPACEPSNARIGAELDLAFDPVDYEEGVGESAVPYVAASVYGEDFWTRHEVRQGLNLYKGAFNKASGRWEWSGRAIVQDQPNSAMMVNSQFEARMLNALEEPLKDEDANDAKEKERQRDARRKNRLLDPLHWQRSRRAPAQEGSYSAYSPLKLVVSHDPSMPAGERPVQTVHYLYKRPMGSSMAYDFEEKEWRPVRPQNYINSLVEAEMAGRRTPSMMDVESGFNAGFDSFDFASLHGGSGAGGLSAALYVESLFRYQSSYGTTGLYYEAEQKGSWPWRAQQYLVASLSGNNQRFGSISLDCFGDRAGILWTVHPDTNYISDVYFVENEGEAWHPTKPQLVATGVAYKALLGYVGLSGTPVVLYRETEKPNRLFVKYRQGDGMWSDPILADEQEPSGTSYSGFDMAIHGDTIFVASGRDGALYCTTLDIFGLARGK